MKNKLTLSGLLLLMTFSGLIAQDVALNLVNKTISGGGLVWSFDVEATAQASYTGANDNWSTMNVRFDLLLPGGVTISSGVGSGLNNYSEASGASVQTTVPGAPVMPYNVEMGIFLNRLASNLDLPINVPVIIGTFTINFSGVVTTANLVDPRDNAIVSGSFYVNPDDVALRRPFFLPAAAPLPIKLSSFTAGKYGERAVKLDWISKSEVNSSYFGVERSVNDIYSFEKIGEVKAAGTSTHEIKYDYIDNNLPFSRDNQHTFYYRLNQVDIDAYSEHSEIRSVTFTDDFTVTVTTYPNPTTSSVFVEMASKNSKADAKLFLMDASGKLVARRNISSNGVTELKVADYQNGIYDIMIEHDGKVYNQKVIKTN